MLATFLACLALISATLLVWQWVAAAAFPLNQRSLTPSSLPAVSILKPVTGANPETAAALSSWFSQAYPGPVEILLAVPSVHDPAHSLIQDLIAKYPKASARLILCPDSHALNRKVGKLTRLSQQARGEVIVISDADVAAPPDLLAQAATILAHPHIGLVHCLYRLADAPTMATRWESFVVNADFWSQVLQDLSFRPLNYGLGAVMMLRRSDLDAIGGFHAIENYLADDNQLGRRITGMGLKTSLCPLVVDCRASPATWSEVWQHQLRWAVTIRVCQPVPYFLSILANGTLWPVLWFASSPSPAIGIAAATLLGLRVVQGLCLEHRFTGNPRDWKRSWLPLFKDSLQVALWALAFTRQHVVWRGARLKVGVDGRLQPDPAATLQVQATPSPPTQSQPSDCPNSHPGPALPLPTPSHEFRIWNPARKQIR